MATRTDPSFKARLPGDLRARIDTAAKENGRSVNAEIVARLEKSFSMDVSDVPLNVIVEIGSSFTAGIFKQMRDEMIHGNMSPDQIRETIAKLADRSAEMHDAILKEKEVSRTKKK
ncbi:MAG TPA: Arc family DNA-binding protein [Geminicoccus sp.]|uniref:Arc family DNA-binding protein n=1 Tax=Geminicoccus sp. TaxID=2024832 RepID=UPI002CB57507|nr:Arc family DNA-binding protein [Geminicoccus sp.]HWL68535.1 Arc family DNA-binding protein [Geminicoccus sp.]